MDPKRLNALVGVALLLICGTLSSVGGWIGLIGAGAFVAYLGLNLGAVFGGIFRPKSFGAIVFEAAISLAGLLIFTLWMPLAPLDLPKTRFIFIIAYLVGAIVVVLRDGVGWKAEKP